MSKIGRRSIPLKNVKVELQGQDVHYKGPNSSGVHHLPDILHAQLVDNGASLLIDCQERTRKNNCVWGLHRSLLSSEIRGAGELFAQEVIIVGLGFKGVASGNKVEFSLGYSHKIPYVLPKGVTIEVDKTGQKLTLKSYDKQLLGSACSYIRSLRPPEPYKGTGIHLLGEKIIRKAGKTRAS